MTYPKLNLGAAMTCAGLFGAALLAVPASAAPLTTAPSFGTGLGSSVADGPMLTTPARYMQGRNMGNGKHPSRPKGQKRRGMTSGGPRY
ncbi:hypothetical protein FF100_13525 [Methylobacterium terricola]|uniref:Uncharacterized protein n=1 Tax=Methylobacterium terricola TaxID=2583531 RepID=A0A5C4LH28_9HYPH|nr:hypothetical protein [Methylobacterium terricola]TNC12688.1 hypothetical protein FF100_13525 [Methylobacterium terricola]